jgi:hypothetical protein
LQTIKCNKTALSKIIGWSSSRYNGYKKSDVIKEIIYYVERGSDCVHEYHSGCYSEAVHIGRMKCSWSGGQYTLEIKDGIAYLHDYTGEPKPYSSESYILEKPAKNTSFISAKRVDYQISKWGIPSGIYEVKGQGVSHFFIEYNGAERQIDKKNCIVIEA